MSKSKKDTVRVQKTDKLNQRKLVRFARRYKVSPISVRELQLGHTEELPRAVAEKLEHAGYVTRVKSKPRDQQERVDDLQTTELNEPVETSDAEETVIVKENVEDDVTGDLEDEEEWS